VDWVWALLGAGVPILASLINLGYRTGRVEQSLRDIEREQEKQDDRMDRIQRDQRGGRDLD